MRQKEFLELCANGTREEIETAIKHGAKVNKKARIYNTNVPPIFVAVMEENFDAIEVLLEYGAFSGEAFTAAITKGKRKILKFLVDCGADINQPNSKSYKPLLAAVTTNNPKVVKWLIELGADVNVKTDTGYNALAYAALMRIEKTKVNPKIISTLMNSGSSYDEALIIAVKSNDVPFLEILVENGADLNHKCTVGDVEHTISPLAAAMFVKEMNIETIAFLIENGADPNELFEFGDDTVTTPLNIAVAENRADVADELVVFGADPDYRDASGRTPLAYSVMTDTLMLDTLLEHGADPNVADNNGRTPLMLAALDVGCEPETMELLVKYGANVNAQDDEGMTALLWTIATRDRTPLFFVAGLIRTGGIMAEGAEEWLFLAVFYACLKHEARITNIKFLLEHGADINIRSHSGINAIMCAADDDEVADMLLDYAGKDDVK